MFCTRMDYSNRQLQDSALKMFQFFFLKLYLNRYHSFDNANVMSAITKQDISDILKFLCILFLLDVFERFSWFPMLINDGF